MPEQVWNLWPWMHLAGRVLFASFFILFGLRHLFDLRRSAAFLQRKHVPGPVPVSVVAGLMLTVGGALVALGWHRFIGAGLLFLVLFPGAWALHPFWNETDPQVRHDEMGHFFKTLALAGASLLVAHYGGAAWPLSLGQ